MQHALKPASRVAGAQVVAAEFFSEFDVAMDETPSALDMGFRGEGLPPLTRDAESRGGFRNRDACAWHTSIGSRRGPSPRGVASTRFVIPESVVRDGCRLRSRINRAPARPPERSGLS